jgi:hypothetical protein
MMIPTLSRTRQVEFNQYITPDGEVYRFNNNIDKFMIAGIGGLGMPPVEYRTQRGPFQDGETPLGFVLGPRVITLLHRYNGECRQDYWDHRAEFMNFIRPNRQTLGSFQSGVLRIIQPNNAMRDLSVFIQSGPGFMGTQQGRWDEFSFQEAIQFIAHDPVLFDPNQTLADLTLPSVSDELEFPITFPIEFGSDGSVPTNEIVYVGTYKSYPTIIMQGPLIQPVIQNITTQEKIQLESTIVSGRTVTINLEFGNKTVTDDLGNNLVGELTSDSDLATFHLEPAPGAPGGVNEIGIAAGETDANSRIAISWFDKYIGV